MPSASGDVVGQSCTRSAVHATACRGGLSQGERSSARAPLASALSVTRIMATVAELRRTLLRIATEGLPLAPVAAIRVVALLDHRTAVRPGEQSSPGRGPARGTGPEITFRALRCGH